MEIRTAQTFFTGFGGADIGLREAGFDVVSGLEYDPQIAEVANTNLGVHVRVADILNVNPFDFPKTDLIHFSPPCTNASVANSKAGECDLDRALSKKICEIINVLQPSFVTLENVSGYRKFESFAFIVTTLNAHGYFVDYQILNSADYGVPQTRKRLILRASKSFLYPLPAPAAWVGWYAAIEDLIDTLPESKFAKWQLERLPEKLDTLLFASGGFDGQIQNSKPHEPSFTITSNQNQQQLRAFLMPCGNTSAATIRACIQPATTVCATVVEKQGMTRAFLVNESSSMEISNATIPASSQAASPRNLNQKAFIIDGRNTRTTNNEPFTLRAQDEPVFTITASDGSERNKAFISGDEPKQGRLIPHEREWLSQGRVVAMTVRALARFQSFPDWYVFPENKGLVCKGIGNAVPSLMMKAIAESLI